MISITIWGEVGPGHMVLLSKGEPALMSGQESLVTVNLMNRCDGNYNTRSPRWSPLSFEEYILL